MQRSGKSTFPELRNKAYRLYLKVKDKIKPLFSSDEKEISRSSIIAAIILSLLLLWVLWLKFSNSASILDTYLFWVNHSLKERFLFVINIKKPAFSVETIVNDIIPNLLVFAPFGIILNHIPWKKSFIRNLLVCFSFSLFIELLQFFTIIGFFSYIDLITNTTGYLLGFAVFKIFEPKLSLKATAIFYRIINTAMLCTFVFAVIVTIDNMDTLIGVITRRIR